MKKIISSLGLASLLLFTSCAVSIGNRSAKVPTEKKIENPMRNYRPSQENLKMLQDYPEAKENEDRYVIWFPPMSKKLEYDRIVEVAPYIVDEVDCNYHSLMGEFEEKNVEGFGYTYYVFNSDGEVMSTMMACPDGKTSKEKIYGEGKLLRYSSNTPIVVYVPKGIKIETNLFVKEG